MMAKTMKTLELHYPMIKFLINDIKIVFFYVGDNVLLAEDRLRAKLTDFGSAGSCQVSYTK